MAAPQKLHDGRELFYEGIFISPFEKKTKKEALIVLNQIRNKFNSRNGWVELKGSAEKLPNGKWHAVRYHAQYIRCHDHYK